MCWAPETCEDDGDDKGRPHYQGYVYFDNPKAFSTMGKLFKGGIGWNKKANGKATANRNYVFGPYDGDDGKHKPINPEAQELGELPEQGARNDLLPVGMAIKSGTKRLRSLLDDEDNWGTLAKYWKFFEKLQQRWDEKEAIRQYNAGEKPEVILHTGPSGSGKTRAVLDTHGCENVYTINFNGKSIWSDNYDGHTVLLFDEFYGEISESFFLQLLDRKPIQMPCKGSFNWRLAKHIYITSEREPHEWWIEDRQSRLTGLTRRIDKHVIFPQV